MNRASRAIQVSLLVLALAGAGRAATPAAGSLRWEEWPGDPSQVALMDGRRQVGVWMVKERAYYPRLGKGRWGRAGRPPIPAPGAKQKRCECDPTCPCVGAECRCNRLSGRCCRDCACEREPGWVTTGVETDKLGGPAYRRGGRAISREQAFEAVRGKGVPDDARRLRVTVIGPAPARQPVLRDLEGHPALAPLKDRVVVQGYDPGDWAVKGYGFVTTGNPTVCVQAPDGTVLHRQDGYRGPERLAEAIRRADPSYDPKLDPDLNRPSPLGLPRVPPLVLVAAGLLGAYLLLPRGDK